MEKAGCGQSGKARILYMIIQFTLRDLMIFLVLALGIVAGALLLPILWNIKKVVSAIRPMVEANQESFGKAIKIIPGIVENVSQISGDVKDTTARLKIAGPVILQDVQLAASSAKGSMASAGVMIENISGGINDTMSSYRESVSENATGFMAYMPVIKEVVQLILRAFSVSK
jgi:hypothetical protein